MRKGFSIVEILVVSFLLLIVSVGTISSFSSIIRTQRYLLRTQELIEEGAYSMDYITRALKMAKRETGEVNCLSYGRSYQYEGQGLRFISKEEERFRCRAFFLDQGVIIEYEEGRNPESIPLTSSDVEIVSFLVEIEDIPNNQPIVNILLQLKPRGLEEPEIELRTAVSQRDLNLPMD